MSSALGRDPYDDDHAVLDDDFLNDGTSTQYDPKQTVATDPV